MKLPSLTLDLKLSSESIGKLQAEAERLGLTNGQLASAMLGASLADTSCAGGTRAAAVLGVVRALFPERWAAMPAEYRQRSELSEDTMTLVLHPTMVEFMSRVGGRFPRLWDRFMADCLDAVIDQLRDYLDDSYSFASPQERMAAFGELEAAREKYRAAVDWPANLRR